MKMHYESTILPDAMSVDGIYTVLRVDSSKRTAKKGESHDFPEISFVSRGISYTTINGIEIERKQGDLIIIEPNSFHKGSRPSDCELLIISFASSSPALKVLYNRKLTLSPKQEKTLRAIVEKGLGLFRYRTPGSGIRGMILKEGADESLLYVIKKEIELFLIDLYTCFSGEKTQKRRDTDFERTVDFLACHINENLSVLEIAEGAKMSISKLKLLFREKSGGGVISYFIEMKIEKAKELIAEGKMNISEISDSLGFNSLHYFSRLFKKLAGLSPSEFKNNLK